MAELMANKSSNVVSSNSNKKNSDVCSVQSNNGLIDLDNITASNNQLITMCDEPEDDDDLIMTKNTKNELSAEDKSLQEMIESELALRICSANEEEDLINVEDEDEATRNQPEVTIKKIILEPRQDPLDINAEFIGAEMEHYAIVQDPYTYRNGHTSPGSAESRSPERPEINEMDEFIPEDKYQHRENDDMLVSTSIEEATQEQATNIRVIEEPVFSLQQSAEAVRPEDEIVEDEILVQSESEPGCWPSSETFKCIKTTNSFTITADEANDKVVESRITDKHLQEENDQTEPVDETTTWIDSEDSQNVSADLLSNENKELDFKDVWLGPASSDGNVTEGGQFSDDFDGITRREDQPPAESEEPEDQLDFQVKSEDTLEEIPLEDVKNHSKDYENLLIDSSENSNNETGPTSEKQHGNLSDNIVDVDHIIEESEKSSESCPSGDSSQIHILPVSSHENITNVDRQFTEDIMRTKCFIGEECNALLKENYEIEMKKEKNLEVEVDDEERSTKELVEENDCRFQLENDVRVFTDAGKSHLANEYHGQDEQRVECETSWMTVEEATNDRNKLDETINGPNTQDGPKEMFDESHIARANDDLVEGGLEAGANTGTSKTKTTNGLESVTDVGTEIHFVASTTRDNDDDDDNDDDSDLSHNTTKIDSLLMQDTTATTTTRLFMSSNMNVAAPLATPDDESSEFSNVCDKESREEVITSSTVVTSTTSTKSSTKTKKKKIEGVAGNDASPTLTPRTKKTKKSKKNDLEKENISVNINTEDPSMHTTSRQMSQEVDDFSDEDDLSNVNVKSLTQSYVSETSRGEQEKSNKEVIETGVSIKQLCRSFGDISNMTDVDQATFGISEQTSETQEKAKSMDDLRLCQRNNKKLAKDATVFVGVSVKALRASYCSLANLTRAIDEEARDQTQTNRLKFEKSSFNKFDALSKKTVLHVRSVDAGKVQQQLNSVGQNGDANPNCRSCGKVVFQMEQTKAEGLVWHKNCFRCVQCSKQLNVDNYQSHESTLYCKAHFKELFQPKPVEESDQPVRPRKPEMIIRENQPKELPPDVVRASDKPDLGLEELSSLNVKSRFQVFEKSTNDTTNEIERSPSQVVKRSPSILSKLAKFQAKGMDIGVADDSLNGIPYEESSESEEEEEIEESEELDSEIVKSKRTTRERPISFTKMDDIKNRWECTSQQGRRESQREARKEEIAGIRSRLFMGKQGKMKEMYQQAVAESERVTKINPTEEIQASTHARSIKERFERGEPIATSDGEDDSKLKQEKPDEEVIAAGISRKSRSLFLELDASAAKTGRPVTPVNPKTPTDVSRRARDAFMGRQVSDDVVRSTDTTEEVQVETSDISNKFKFFETYKEPAKERKQFRITPPRDGQVKQMGSPEREIYRDPDVVRADDRVDEVVHTDTARKMLSIFRQMEEKATKEDIPDGPKPLKRFTPPPEDKFAKATASESEDEEEEEGEESEGEESGEERDPNYVRASDKVEDEFLKQAQNAARAKTLRAKFEHWETTDGKVTSHHVAEMDMAQGNGDQASIESASSLRARFESLGSQPSDSPRAAKVKVNRFVEIQTICMDVCESCQKKVYPLEKVETNNKIFHKQCFRCLQCNCVLRMDTFTLNNGKLYCIPHFKQLFIARGNYDEGFGVDPHKNKWATNNTNSTSAAGSAAIAVSNGRATSVANRV